MKAAGGIRSANPDYRDWETERLIKPGNSWFSAKSIEVERQMYADGGRVLDGLGGRELDPNPGDLGMTRLKVR